MVTILTAAETAADMLEGHVAIEYTFTVFGIVKMTASFEYRNWFINFFFFLAGELYIQIENPLNLVKNWRSHCNMAGNSFVEEDGICKRSSIWDTVSCRQVHLLDVWISRVYSGASKF